MIHGNQNNSQAPLLEYERKCKKERKSGNFKSPQWNYTCEKFITMKWQWKQLSYAPASFCGIAFMYVQFNHPDWLAVVKMNKTLLQRIARKNLIVVYELAITKIILFKDVSHHVRSKPDICVAPSISCPFNLNSKLAKLIINFLIEAK